MNKWNPMNWFRNRNKDAYNNSEIREWTTDQPVEGPGSEAKIYKGWPAYDRGEYTLEEGKVDDKPKWNTGFKEGWGDFKSDLASGLLDAAKGHDFFGTGSYAAQTNPQHQAAVDAAKGYQQVHKLSDNFVVDYGPWVEPGAKVLQHATPPTPSFGEKAFNILGQEAIKYGTAALLACDERVKYDISPLAISEVHDELAEIAFFVKELRECA